MLSLHKENNKAIQITSFSVFLFFALMFALRSGYSYGSGLLLLTSLIVLPQKPHVELKREDKIIIYILLSVFLISLFTVLLHGNSFKNIDQSSRYLLAIPVLLLLLKSPPRIGYVWAGIIVGIILSVGIATWQLAHGYDRVEGYLNIIHFGNIALVFGVFCLAGIFWAQNQPKNTRLWQGFFLLGIFSSIFSIIASGSRGTWSALPALLILICITFINKRNIRQMLIIGFSFIFIVGILFSIPNTKLESRANDAVSDITNYFYKQDPRTSVGARFEMWHGAILNIPKKPLLGWSEKDYADELKILVSEGKLDPVAIEFSNNLHNNFIQVLVFQGAIGLLALLTLYIFSFGFFYKRLWSKNYTIKTLAFCGATLISSYFFFSMSQVILARNNGVMFFLMTLIIIWACIRQEEKAKAQ